MAFDFRNLLGDTPEQIDPEGFGGPQVGETFGGEAEAGFNFQELLSDPNFIRMLGELGSGIGGKGSVGDILGTAGSTFARRKAVQGVGEQQLRKNRTLQERLLEAIQSGELLGPKDKDDTFDDVTIGGDGSLKLNMRATPKTPTGFQGEQRPLESITGGQDLPDFPENSLL